MQQLLPLAIRGCLPENVRKAIIRMCFYFNALCSRVLETKSLDELEKQHYVTMCLFEQFFQPSFFNIMVHLTVHLIDQVRLCGSVIDNKKCIFNNDKIISFPLIVSINALIISKLS